MNNWDTGIWDGVIEGENGIFASIKCSNSLQAKRAELERLLLMLAIFPINGNILCYLCYSVNVNEC
jgi:hypothetical protein